MKRDQPARIVLIEDNPGDIFLLRHALDLHGGLYKLNVLEDGDKALNFVREYGDRTSEPMPCVLVLDLHLPKHSGLVVLKAIREDSALSRVQVMALSGTISPAEETELRSLGVGLYRQKPLDLEGLSRLAEEIIAVCKENLSAGIAARRLDLRGDS